MKLQIFIILFGFLFIINIWGCGEFFININTNEEWIIRSKDNIVVHYRPERYTNTPSPTDSIVNIILDNKNHFYELIMDTLDIKFSDNILVYLYNSGEAYQKIDRSKGGYAITEMLSYYWVYDGRPRIHPNGRTIFAGGAHELVHVITGQVLGKPGTHALDEGYAVAIDGRSVNTVFEDGFLRYRTVVELMDEYFKNGIVLKPGKLLYKIEFNEYYYANAGFFTMFLFESYGIEITNQLFPVPESKFRQRFFELTGVTFEEMEQIYLDYCDDMFGAG